MGMTAAVKVYDMVGDKYYQGTIANLSVGGLGLLLDDKLEARAPIAVEFELPPRMVLRHVQAHVVRVHRVGAQYMIGVKFYRMPRQIEEDFERFVGLSSAARPGSS